MKLSDQIKACHDSQPFYTFEFFPPRTDQVRLGPIFQNHTFSSNTIAPSRDLTTWWPVFRDYLPWILWRSASHGALAAQLGIEVLNLLDWLKRRVWVRYSTSHVPTWKKALSMMYFRYIVTSLLLVFLFSVALKRQPKSREYKIFLPFEEVGPFTFYWNYISFIMFKRSATRKGGVDPFWSPFYSSGRSRFIYTFRARLFFLVLHRRCR